MKNNKIYIFIVLISLLLIGSYFVSSQKTEYEKLPVENNEGVINGSVMEPLALQAGLPEKVEAKRQAIYEASHSRNYETLATLATPTNFSYSFGAPYESFAAYMQLSEDTEGESAFDIIPNILRLPYSKSGEIYAWPGVSTKQPKDWTAEDVATMKTFLTDEQIESYREFGGYIYYRLGIDVNGEWIYFIAGD